MADQNQDAPNETTQEPEKTLEPQAQQEPSPAEALNTSSGPAPVPYDRFKETRDRMNDLEAKLKAYEEAEQKRKEADMSELEKANARIAKLEQEKQDAINAAKAVEEARIADRRNTAFKAAAKGAVDADALLAYVLVNKADALAGVVNASGNVDDKELDKLIKNLQTEKPALFGSRGAGSPSNAGGYLHNPQNTNAVKEAEDRLRQLMNK